MRYLIFKALILFFLLSLDLFSQIITGKIIDAESGSAITDCNISIVGTYRGTTTNLDGIYKLKLPSGKYELLFQYIGYKSEKFKIELTQQKLTIDIKLEPQVLSFDSITIYASRYSEAESLILKASKRKKQSLKFINNYFCNSYTKTSFKASNKNIYGGIFETFSELYFNAPNRWHEVLLSQKQTVNIPRTSNFVSGNTFLDINQDLIQLGERNIIGPTNPEAVLYYNYEFIDTLYQDNNRIFGIKFSPKKDNIPAMSGKLYLVDKYFIISNIDATLNEECNYDVFENIRIIQRYKAINDSVYLPNYSLRESNFVIDIPKFPALLIKKENFRENYIINNYNNKIAPYEETREIKNTISFDSIPMHIPPLTVNEKRGYSKIDSLFNQNNKIYIYKQIINFIDYYSYLEKLPIGNFSDFFHFNRVEGIFGGISIDSKDYFKNISLKTGYGYGSEDRNSKYFVYPSLEFKNKEIALKLTFGYYDKLETREQTKEFPIWANSFESIFYNFDYFDYYYSKGSSINLNLKIKRLDFTASYKNESHSNANRNLNFALFKNDLFIDNLAISSGKVIGPSIAIKYSDIAYLGSGISKELIPNQRFTELIFSVNNGIKSLGSDFNFYKYQLMLYIRKNTPLNGFVDISLFFGTSTGTLPLQKHFEIASGFSGYGRFKAFSTLGQNSFIGKNKASMYFEHKFHDSIFKLTNLPFVKKIPWEFSLIYNTGWAGNKKIERITFNDFYSEAGFGLNKVFNILKFEFIWRTKYFENSNFFSINLKIDNFEIF